MKILLLNSNPVVNKLVTLSAQKTNDSVEAFEDTAAIKMGGKYDLLIVDDSVYSVEAMDELLSKVEYEKSLYICSRDADVPNEFDSATRKPFLPTDLVEQFAAFSKSMHLAKNDSMKSTESKNSEPELHDDIDMDEFDTIEEFGELEDIEMLDTLTPQENKIQELEVFEDIKDDFDSFLEIQDDKEDKTSILDKDDLKEVQSLLDDTEDDDILDDDFEFEDANKELSFDEEEFDFDMEKDDAMASKEELEDELNFDIEEDLQEQSSQEMNLDDELFMNDEEIEEASAESKEDFDFDIEDDNISASQEINEPENKPNLDIEEDIQESVAQEMNLDNDFIADEVQEDFETQIQDAMSQLSQEDLDRELDDDILLELDSLTSKDLKLALGEEVDDGDSVQAFDTDILEDTLQDEVFENMIEKEDGVEALKKLLEALTSKDVVASLAGKKININITIG